MHDLNHTATFSDEIVLLNKGKVIEHGSPKKVLTPETLEKTYDIPFEVTENKRGELSINCFKRQQKEELTW